MEDGRRNARKSDKLTLSRGEVLSAGLGQKEIDGVSQPRKSKGGTKNDEPLTVIGVSRLIACPPGVVVPSDVLASWSPVSPDDFKAA